MSDLQTFHNSRRVSDLAVYSRKPSDTPVANAILFVHGIWGGSWVWQHYVPYFIALGYPCYAMDLRGHGDSKPVVNVGKVSLEDYLEDVKRVVQILERPILVGHSMGGLLVLKISEAYDPAATVLVCPSQSKGNFGPPAGAQLRFLGRHVIALLRGEPIKPSRSEAERTALNRLRDEDLDWVFRHSAPGSGRALREMILGRISVDPSRIRCPVLAIGASDDNTSPARVVERVVARYRGKYREYPNAGHMLPLEPEGMGAAQHVSSWLLKVLAAA